MDAPLYPNREQMKSSVLGYPNTPILGYPNTCFVLLGLDRASKETSSPVLGDRNLDGLSEASSSMEIARTPMQTVATFN